MSDISYGSPSPRALTFLDTTIHSEQHYYSTCSSHARSPTPSQIARIEAGFSDEEAEVPSSVSPSVIVPGTPPTTDTALTTSDVRRLTPGMAETHQGGVPLLETPGGQPGSDNPSPPAPSPSTAISDNFRQEPPTNRPWGPPSWDPQPLPFSISDTLARSAIQATEDLVNDPRNLGDIPANDPNRLREEFAERRWAAHSSLNRQAPIFQSAAIGDLSTLSSSDIQHRIRALKEEGK